MNMNTHLQTHPPRAAWLILLLSWQATLAPAPEDPAPVPLPIPVAILQVEPPAQLPLDLPAPPLAFALPSGPPTQPPSGVQNIAFEPGQAAAWQFSPIPDWGGTSQGVHVGESPTPFDLRLAAYPCERRIHAVLLRGYSAAPASAAWSLALPGGETMQGMLNEVTLSPGLLRIDLPQPLTLLADQSITLQFTPPAESTWLGDGPAPLWCGVEAELLAPETVEFTWTWEQDILQFDLAPQAALGPDAMVALALPLSGAASPTGEFLQSIEAHSGRYLPAQQFVGRTERHPEWRLRHPGPQIRLLFSPAKTGFLLDGIDGIQLWKSKLHPQHLLLAIPMNGRMQLQRPAETQVPPLNIPSLQPGDPAFGERLQEVYRRSVFAWEPPLPVPSPHLDLLARIHGWDGTQRAEAIATAAVQTIQIESELRPSPRLLLEAVTALSEIALWRHDPQAVQADHAKILDLLTQFVPVDGPSTVDLPAGLAWFNAVRSFREACRLAKLDPGWSASELERVRTAWIERHWDGTTSTLQANSPHQGILETLGYAAGGWLEPERLSGFIGLLDALRSTNGDASPLPLGTLGSRRPWIELAWEMEARARGGDFNTAWQLFQNSIIRLDRALLNAPGTDVSVTGIPSATGAEAGGDLQAVIPGAYTTLFFGIAPTADGLLFAPTFPKELALSLLSRLRYGQWHLACARHFNLAVLRIIESGLQTGGIATVEEPFLLSEEALREGGGASILNRSIWHRLLPIGVDPTPAPMMPPPP
ncbi:MAG: hypothetical protein QM518_13400 [Verrucomicrobiota bacterium]|nr:hypothetical protein [Verrucomicrobiota bacterium]